MGGHKKDRRPQSFSDATSTIRKAQCDQNDEDKF